MTTVASPVAGRVVPLEDVADDVFAERVMGDGVAVVPTDGTVVAPVAGTVAKLFPGGHGIAVETDDGVAVLVHVGLETVHLRGRGFTVHTTQGATVAAGEPLVTVDVAMLAAGGVDLTTPVVVISGEAVRVLAAGEVDRGTALLAVDG